MLRFATDQNFDGRILAGLRRRLRAVDVERVQEAGLSRALDPMVLQWAAAHERVLLTHDRKTIPKFAYERVGDGLPMPGVVVVLSSIPIGQAVEELTLVAQAMKPEEIKDRVVFLPL